jgi:ABC-type glycerol-3-phosphate transport system substrate-binding protein
MRKKPTALPVAALIALLLILFTACDTGDQETGATVTATSTRDAAATMEPTPPVALTPIAAQTPGSPQQAITLTVWTRQEVVPDSQQPGGAVLLDQLNSFDQQRSDLHLKVEVKATTGQGGALSYLRSGRAVAPDILPDLVLLPATQLVDAVADRLLYPLGEAVGPDAIAQLYPAAQALSQVDGVTYGYPYVLTSLQHFVYDTATITHTLPVTWPGLLSAENDVRFIFPAVGLDGGIFTLQLYLAAGGTLRNDTGQLAIQPERLAEALRQIEQGIASGRILPQSAATSTLDQAWQVFQNSTANIVLSNGTTYRQQQNPAGRYAFTRLPGLDQALPLRPGALLWVVTTPDPVRQRLAVDLLNWLSDPENLAAWSYAAYTVPARAEALTLWPGEDAHAAFLARNLPDARPLPPDANTTLLGVLAAATESVAAGVQTAAAAAETAANALRP